MLYLILVTKFSESSLSSNAPPSLVLHLKTICCEHPWQDRDTSPTYKYQLAKKEGYTYCLPNPFKLSADPPPHSLSMPLTPITAQHITDPHFD